MVYGTISYFKGLLPYPQRTQPLHAILCPAEAVSQDRPSMVPYDCLMIGSGVGTDKEHFLMFEKLINTVQQRDEGHDAKSTCIDTIVSKSP